MNTHDLLQELEPLTHDERTVRMIELGRRSQEVDVTTILDVLEHGSFYERRLSLVSCFSSRDAARVVRFLDDPSRMIRGLALRLAVLCCDDDSLLAVLEAAPLKTKRALLQSMRKRRRLTAIDLYLGTLAERSDENLDRFLAFGSPQFVAARVDEVFDQTGAADWSRLARFHPSLAAGVLQRRAEAAQTLDQRLISRANGALFWVAEHNPQAALNLVDVLGRHASLSSLNLQRLAERTPAAIIDLMIAGADIGAVSFQKVISKLDIRQLRWLLEHCSQSLNITYVWRRLPRETRAAVYEFAHRGWRSVDGIITRELLAHSERPQREAEGRRHLALPALATRPGQRLPYAALLPWDDAREALEPFIRNPDPELRAIALPALIFAARYHRSRLPELLELVSARRNEQDPIRGAMLVGLAALPPGAWQEHHLEALGQIIRQALDASDLSMTTASAAERLIVALLPRHPYWSAEWLATLVRERGQIGIHDLSNRLSDADVQRLAPALWPVLQSWDTRERETQILNVARSLGNRLRVWDELCDLVERVVVRGLTTWNADGGLALLAMCRPQRLLTLIPELVKADPSWVTRPVVYIFLHRRRQDVLTPLLGQTAFSGRFSTGRTRWVLPLFNGFARWTPHQQSIFEKTLRRVTQDSERDSPSILQVIRQLAALPDIEPARLINLADVRNPKIAVRDAALRALGQLDAGQGIPSLLEAMGDDRARIAIYALRHSLLGMPEDRALDLLRAIPLDKVTVAKEVVRLLGELRSLEAYHELLALNERDLHRDVHVALLRALWDHLEREETWPILEHAARSMDPAIATMAGRTPADRLSAVAQRRLAALVAGLLENRDPKVRVDVLIRCAQLPIHDRDQVLLQPLLAALNSHLPDECEWASNAVFATYAGRRETLIGDAVTKVLPNRRSLHTIIRYLKAGLYSNRAHLLPSARAVLKSLSADPLTASMQIELAVAALPANEIAALLVHLANSAQLHAEVLSSAITALQGASARFTLEELESLEKTLVGHPDTHLRRLGLAALVAQASPPRGWNTQRLAQLHKYRAAAAVLVAAAAQFTFVDETDVNETDADETGGVSSEVDRMR